MKLLTVNYECPPQGGGAGVVMLDLIRALGAIPDLFQSVICGWDYAYGSPPDIPTVHAAFVPMRRRSIHQTGLIAVSQFSARAWKEIQKPTYADIDVVHFHFSVPTGMLAWAVPDRPYVCSTHGIDVPGFVNEQALMQRLLRPLNRRVLARAARVCAPSSRVRELIEKTCPEARVETVPHGVNDERIQVKSTYTLTARRFVTVARLANWKRVHHVVEGVAALRSMNLDVSLDIFGDGAERANIDRLIRERGAREYISMRGVVPRDYLEANLQSYDAFVLPSVTEAFGLVFLEAMAAGLAVVGFAAGGPADLLDHGVDGLLIREDTAESLIDPLVRLAREPGLAESLGRAARAKVRERYTWSAVSERYYRIYDSVASNDRGSQ